MFLCTLFCDFSFPKLVIIFLIFPIQVFLLNYCLHCLQGPKSLIFNRLSRNNDCLLLFLIVYCWSLPRGPISPAWGTQKTRAPLSPGRSSFLKFPAKADLIPRSGQLEVPHIGYIYSEIPVIYASPSPNLPE